MQHGRFVVGRDPRHRIAALALYRALLRSARQVEVPPPPPPAAGARPMKKKAIRKSKAHPLVDMVEKRFRSNRTDTSMRLVYSSMAAGYKFLNLLNGARNTGSPDHERALELVRERRQAAEEARQRGARAVEERAAAAASGAPTTPRQRAAQRMATYLSTTKQKDRTPLLVKVSGPGELPRYEGRVRPASELKGPRRPPKMATQALGIPLLRYARPGPIAWRNRVCQQVNLWQGRVDAIRTAEADWVVWGALEDRWDEAMQAEMARAGVKPDPRDRADGHETSWIWSPLLSKLWYENRLEHMWNDWVARGEAMHRIVKEETALAVAEGAMTPEQASPLYRRPRSKRSKGRAGTGGLQPLADMLEPKQQQQQQAQNKSQKKQKQKQTQARGPPVPANMVIDKRNRAPAVTAEMDAMRDLYLRRGKAAPPTREGDMFAHPVWTATVKNAHGRVLGWAKRAPTGRDRTQLPASIAYGGRDANSGPASAGQSSFFL